MKIANRSLASFLTALAAPQHYRAAVNMFRVYQNTPDAYRRYLFGMGRCPADIALNTPLGKITVRVYSPHDVLTINEIFCRMDYQATRDDAIFVDFGANIGISAAYFLTRGTRGFAYLYEPVPRNLDRLRMNLHFVEGRFAIEEVAVGPSAGVVKFGVEESGRYGGIGVHTGQEIEVRCADSNAVLESIIARHNRIDILKIDIEGLESEVVCRIPKNVRSHIRKIYAECRFSQNPLADTHSYRQYGSVAQFTKFPTL